LIHSLRPSSNIQLGPCWIGIGLAILFAATWWPDAPVVTAMAIIALGATDVTLSRFCGSVAALPVVMLHAATYSLLYALFIGARLHGAGGAAGAGMSGFATFDLAASFVPMAIALKHVSSCLRQSIMSRR
jgi:hypothetical protein